MDREVIYDKQGVVVMAEYNGSGKVVKINIIQNSHGLASIWVGANVKEYDAKNKR